MIIELLKEAIREQHNLRFRNVIRQICLINLLLIHEMGQIIDSYLSFERIDDEL